MRERASQVLIPEEGPDLRGAAAGRAGGLDGPRARQSCRERLPGHSLTAPRATLESGAFRSKTGASRSRRRRPARGSRIVNTRPIRNGTVFKHGKLYVFSPERIVVLRGGSTPRAWRMSAATRRWLGWEPDFDFGSFVRAAREAARTPLPERLPGGQLVAPDGQLYLPGVPVRAPWRAHAIAAFLATFEPGVIDLAIRHRWSHWPLVALYARSRSARELAVHQPVIAFAVAFASRIHPHPPQRLFRAARAWLARPAREVLGWLGFPPTKATVRLFGRIEPEHLSPYDLTDLRTALQDPAVRRLLAHLPRVNDSVISVAAAPDVIAHLAPTFLERLAETREPSYPLVILRSTLAKAERLGKRPPRLRGWADVSAIEDEYRRRFGHPKAVEFPPPPLPGTELVVPVTTHDALVEEGQTMHHCIRSYAARVASGAVYVYRLLAPERATVAIVRRAGNWELLDVRGRSNLVPAPPTWSAVHSWLEAARGERGPDDEDG
jgi:hypothetical protein